MLVLRYGDGPFNVGLYQYVVSLSMTLSKLFQSTQMTNDYLVGAPS